VACEIYWFASARDAVALGAEPLMDLVDVEWLTCFFEDLDDTAFDVLSDGLLSLGPCNSGGAAAFGWFRRLDVEGGEERPQEGAPLLQAGALRKQRCELLLETLNVGVHGIQPVQDLFGAEG